MPNHPLLDEWQDRIAKLNQAQLHDPCWYNEVQIKILRFLISRYGDQDSSTPIRAAKPSPNHMDSIPVSSTAGLRSRKTFREHLSRIQEVASERDERVFTDEGA